MSSVGVDNVREKRIVSGRSKNSILQEMLKHCPGSSTGHGTRNNVDQR